MLSGAPAFRASRLFRRDSIGEVALTNGLKAEARALRAQLSRAAVRPAAHRKVQESRCVKGLKRASDRGGVTLMRVNWRKPFDRQRVTR
jgi:hypothetical protein